MTLIKQPATPSVALDKNAPEAKLISYWQWRIFACVYLWFGPLSFIDEVIADQRKAYQMLVWGHPA